MLKNSKHLTHTMGGMEPPPLLATVTKEVGATRPPGELRLVTHLYQESPATLQEVLSRPSSITARGLTVMCLTLATILLSGGTSQLVRGCMALCSIVRNLLPVRASEFVSCRMICTYQV